MKLLIYCNKFDGHDDLLGFFPGWVDRLLGYFERITILTPQVGDYGQSKKLVVVKLPNKRGARLLRFYRELLTRRHEYETIFILMAPAWLIAAAPARLFGKRLTLWYAVWKKTPKLRLATLLANSIVASVPAAFPIATSKLRTVGQGIDTEYFVPDPSKRIKGRVLSLGRISPIKKLENIIEIIPQVQGLEKLDIVGGPVNKNDFEYFEKLKRQAEKLELKERVHFHGRVSHNEIVSFYQQADIFVNLTQTGSFDKAMLEAMASGCLLLTANKAFSKEFQGSMKEQLLIDIKDEKKLVLEDSDFESVLSHLRSVFNLSDGEKGKIREELRQLVINQHSLTVMIPKLAQVLQS